MGKWLVLGSLMLAASCGGAWEEAEDSVATRITRVSYCEGANIEVEIGIHANGQLAFRQEWRVDAAGQRAHADGVAREWFQNGVVASERGHRDGELDGALRSWFADGTLMAETEYRAGRKHGLERTWNADGELVSLAEWENGRRGAHERTGARAPDLDPVTVANVFGSSGGER